MRIRQLAATGLLVAIIVVIVAVVTQGTDPLAALASACRGDGVARAGVFAAGHGPNHLAIIHGDGVDGSTRRMPAEWVPASVEATELVACLPAEPVATEVEVCSYTGGSNVTRYRASADVRIVEARTGAEVAVVTLAGEPAACNATERQDVTRIDGVIDYLQLTTRLADIVASGTARTSPGSSSGGSAASPEPEAETPPAAPTPAATPVRMELIKAVVAGDVDVKPTGDSLQALDLTIESNVDFDLEIVINPGTVFEPSSGSVQTMVVVARETVEVEAKLEVDVELDVACADMDLDTPGGSDTFSLRTGSVPKEIIKLTRLDGFAAEEFRIQQFALWTITDNPTRNGYVGLGSFGVGSGPTDEELVRIRELFKDAGINPDRYHALASL